MHDMKLQSGRKSVRHPRTLETSCQFPPCRQKQAQRQMRPHLCIRTLRCLEVEPIAQHVRIATGVRLAGSAPCVRYLCSPASAWSSRTVVRAPANPPETQRRDESRAEQLTHGERQKQLRTLWHREGSNVPPVHRPRSAGAMTKGESASVMNVLASGPDLLHYRQAAHHAFQTPETRHTPEHARQEHGSQGH